MPVICSMRSSTKLALSYGIFALVATVANIGAQDIIVQIYDGVFHVWVSIIGGTGVGLLVKYFLDKHYIFRFRPKDVVHDAQVFLLYIGMGLITTILFWASELGFDAVFETKEMRYLGGCVGLAIGYLVKYHLDKRFVFRSDAL